MTPNSETHRRGGRWPLAAWGAAATILLAPAIAMQVTDEVRWSLGDFLFMGSLLFGVCLGIELAVRWNASLAYRAGATLALVTGVLLLWINAAVGVVGDESQQWNAVYFGPPAVALAGALVARFRAAGMAWAMVAAATAVALAPLLASMSWAGAAASASTAPALALTAGFAVLWLTAAWLFRKAAS